MEYAERGRNVPCVVRSVTAVRQFELPVNAQREREHRSGPGKLAFSMAENKNDAIEKQRHPCIPEYFYPQRRCLDCNPVNDIGRLNALCGSRIETRYSVFRKKYIEIGRYGLLPIHANFAGFVFENDGVTAQRGMPQKIVHTHGWKFLSVEFDFGICDRADVRNLKDKAFRIVHFQGGGAGSPCG